MVRMFLGLLLICLSFGASAQDVKGVVLDEPVPVAKFSLVAQNGTPFTLSLIHI